MESVERIRVDVSPKGGMGLFATTPFAIGERVVTFVGPIVRDQHEHALQVGPDEYIGPSGGPDDFVNHSCDPNTAFEPGTLTLVARRRIAQGEEITFDYCSADWENGAQNFECRCSAATCRGRILGYRHLSAEERRRVPTALPHLLELAARESDAASIR